MVNWTKLKPKQRNQNTEEKTQIRQSNHVYTLKTLGSRSLTKISSLLSSNICKNSDRNIGDLAANINLWAWNFSPSTSKVTSEPSKFSSSAPKWAPILDSGIEIVCEWGRSIDETTTPTVQFICKQSSLR